MGSLSQGQGQDTGIETLIAFAYLSKRALIRQAPAPAWMAASNRGSSAAKSDVTIVHECQESISASCRWAQRRLDSLSVLSMRRRAEMALSFGF